MPGSSGWEGHPTFARLIPAFADVQRGRPSSPAALNSASAFSDCRLFGGHYFVWPRTTLSAKSPDSVVHAPGFNARGSHVAWLHASGVANPLDASLFCPRSGTQSPGILTFAHARQGCTLTSVLLPESRRTRPQLKSGGGQRSWRLPISNPCRSHLDGLLDGLSRQEQS